MANGKAAADTDYGLETAGGTPVETKAQLMRAESLETTERRNRILKLRRQGFTHEAIAKIISEGEDEGPAMPVGHTTVHRIITAYVAELVQENAENADVLRQIDNERLETMYRRLEQDALSTDPAVRRGAILAQVKILQRHARLNGLDQPEVVRHEGDVDHHVVASPEHVRAVDESFARRHGGKVIDLPAGDAREVE